PGQPTFTGSEKPMDQRVFCKILRGQSDANISFSELRTLLIALGFVERIRGSHHIFRRPGIDERINIQRDGSSAKPYQVRQIRTILVKYQFGDRHDA
ncbi:type II toxin-antitoxin system HicA family toxin, partial [Pseudomonadales bacterium]|nr:type II toxin-antitoxin system HicA family toxin [Pseudomonadales bacterium]